MKSKVILFCVLLFCSKFVESIPFSEEHVNQGAYQPSIWQENQNAPGQHPNSFTRTQNVNSARRNDNIPEYYQNPERLNDESYGYNNNLPFITPAKEVLANYDSAADEQRLNSYPPRVESFPRRIDAPHSRFENKNWRAQNQYVNPVESGDNIAIKEQPLMTTARNPHRGPVQYQPPKFTSSSSRPYYEGERAYPPREQYYQEQPLPGPSSSIPYVNSNDAAIITSGAKDRNFDGSEYVEPLLGGNYNGAPSVIADVLANNFGNKQYVNTHQSRSGNIKNYNDSPSDIMYPSTENIENRRAVNNYGPSQDAVRNSNQIPIITTSINNNNNDDSFILSDTLVEESVNRRYNNMDNYRPRPLTIKPVPIKPINNYNPVPDSVGAKSGNRYINNYKDGQSDVTLEDKPRINRYGPNYARPVNLDKIVPVNNYNVGPAGKINTGLEKSGNSEYFIAGHGSEFGSKKLPTVTTDNKQNAVSAIDTVTAQTGKKLFIDNFRPQKLVPSRKNTGTSGTLIDSGILNSNNDKPSDINKPPYGPSNPAPADLNLDQKDQQPKIQSFSFKDILSKAQVESILSGNSKRFVIVHPNKTVEYVDKFDVRNEDSKKYRLINATQFHEAYGDRVGNGSNSTGSPAVVPVNSATPIVLAGGHTLTPDFNQSEKNNNSKPLVPTKSDDPIVSTLSPIVPYNNTSPKPLLPKTLDKKNDQQPTTNSPVVTTTPHPDNSSDIITISPIELATDNVSDVPPVTTTTENPVITTVTLETVTHAYGKQDVAYDGGNSSSSIASTSTSESVQKQSTTTVSPSKSVSVNKDDSDSGIVIEIMTNVNGTQNNETIIVNDEKNATHAATNNSLINSDVPTTHDDYSPVTTELSIQNDVNTSDTSTTLDDNSSEYKQSETDIKLTLSTTNDSEDEINISIEVSESTDDDDSSDEDVMLVQIDTKKSKKDDSKTLNSDDCKKDRNNQSNSDTAKSKNVQIDLANIKGEPMVWFKTTNQDFIHKLMSKNDTSFDVMYFFDMHDKMIIEKDKHTTIFCNGTVVIDQTETTWQFENDPSPKIEKTQTTIDIKDYKP